MGRGQARPSLFCFIPTSTENLRLHPLSVPSSPSPLLFNLRNTYLLSFPRLLTESSPPCAKSSPQIYSSPPPPQSQKGICFSILFLYFFFLTFAHSTHHPRLEPALGEDLRQPYARTFYACIAQCPHSRSKREPFPSLSPPPHPVPPTHHERAPQPNYIKTRRFAGPLTWSTPTALMYAAQPNGADSATINPAALASQGMFVSFPCPSQLIIALASPPHPLPRLRNDSSSTNISFVARPPPPRRASSPRPSLLGMPLMLPLSLLD